jgi:tetratricopeptide (TPR) repeat protein
MEYKQNRKSFTILFVRNLMKHLVLLIFFCLISWTISAQTAEEVVQSGLQYAQNGNYKKALKAYNKAILLNPALAEAYYHRGEIHYELRDYKAMLEDNREAVRLKPDYQNAYFHVGIAYYKLEEYAQAIQHLSKLLTLKPTDSEALYWRGMAYHKAKQPKLACQDWEESQKLGNGLATTMLYKHCLEENAVEAGN